MKNKKPITKFIINDSKSWGGVKFLGKECKIYEYSFINGYYEDENKPSTVKVLTNLSWDIYNSTTFEKELTKIIKLENPEMKIKRIVFSEQGLQDDAYADMDVIY